jgi:hypothetical protein
MSVNNTQRTLLANYLLGQNSSRNYVKNQFAKDGTTNVSVSGGATVAKNTTTPLTGISDFLVTLGNNTTDYVEWSLDTLDRSLTNQNCQLTLDYKIGSVGSVVQAQVVIGGAVSNTYPLASTPSQSSVTLNVPCGDLSGSTTIRVANATGNSGTSSINVANLNYSKATNIGTVAQAILMDAVTVTGCAGAWTTTSATFATLGTQTGCTYTSAKGVATAPATNIPAFKFSSLPPGDYRIEYEGRIGTSAGNDSFSQFSDGTNTARENTYITNQSGTGVNMYGSSVSQTISYSAPQSNVTLDLKAKVAGGGTVQIYGTTSNPGVFKLWYFPSASQQAVSSANADYDWTAFTPTLSAGFGTTTNVSFFQKRRGGDLLVKGTFTAGTVTTGFGTITLPNSLTLDTTRISVANTTANGGQKVGDYAENGTTGIFGNIVTATGTSTTLVYITDKLSTTAPLTPVANVSTPFANSGVTSVNFTVPISGWNENQRAPTLVGSVTSNATNAVRMEYATVTASCTSSPCTIVSGNSGTWLTNITRASGGNYTAVIPAGVFSAVPSCQAWNFTANRYMIGNGDTTTTAFPFQTSDSADAKFSITCIGPR